MRSIETLYLTNHLTRKLPGSELRLGQPLTLKVSYRAIFNITIGGTIVWSWQPQTSEEGGLWRGRLCAEPGTKTYSVADRMYLYYLGRGCSSVGRTSDRHAADAVSIPRCGKGFFSQSQLSVQTLLKGVRMPARAIACIYICVHVKDPVLHARVRWIIETVKHPACPVGWVARLCRSWLSPRNATRISRRRNSTGTIQL